MKKLTLILIMLLGFGLAAVSYIYAEAVETTKSASIEGNPEGTTINPQGSVIPGGPVHVNPSKGSATGDETNRQVDKQVDKSAPVSVD